MRAATRLRACTVLGALLAACSGRSRPPPVETTSSSSPPPSAPSIGDAGASAWGPSLCPPVPAGEQAGVAVGAHLIDMNLKDCDGNDYSVSQLCGASAVWIFVADAWCLPCQRVSQASESLYRSFAGKNVAAVNVLVEDTAGNPATAADCRLWRDTFGLNGVVPLYDPLAVTNPLYDVPSTTLSVFLDHAWTIVDKVHTEDGAAISSEIDTALSH